MPDTKGLQEYITGTGRRNAVLDETLQPSTQTAPNPNYDKFGGRTTPEEYAERMRARAAALRKFRPDLKQ